MSSRATLLTCSHAKDLPRFVLQRESIERCAIDMPHVAVVNTEDVPAFERIEFKRNLKIVPTAAVIGPNLEKRRLARRYPRRHPLYWIRHKPLEGWWVQQLAKLNAPSLIQTEAIISLDSDTFFIRHVREEDFFSEDGRLHLYETRDGLMVTTCNWLGRSMHFLGVSTDQPARQYIHNPVPMKRQLLLDMQAYIEARHKKSWMKAMLQWNVTEYSTYGVYAKHIARLKDLCLTRPPISISYWSESDVANFESDFPEKTEDVRTKMVCVQSHTGLTLDDFRPYVEKIWAASGAGERDFGPLVRV
ncbi:MAG: DUF6492 family protein [Tepidisphaeraceae bacterium]|jgi:hypothetical protein